ncbi:Eco57I restriction-modification methylase domain-containing protein [Sorangium sp. So ce861]|uniref:Eco57I restriction-modification methylase domain-containing protein n=1 Tax=Sorangium sp. So ce861 TaxID=3133323 RepID=UPI003F6107D6
MVDDVPEPGDDDADGAEVVQGVRLARARPTSPSEMSATRKPLFNACILERAVTKHIADGHGPPEGAGDVIRTWYQQLSTGVLSRYSETQVEQAFNAAIFEKVLGYVPFGQGLVHHIVPKRTSPDNQNIPDFVLGTFNPLGNVERWRAVGEIKAVNVNLDLPQTSRRNHETPVQQAFRYALTGKHGVEWVILTNFAEIRLYRNGYTEACQQWTLEELCREDRLVEFHMLLCREHIAPEHGEPYTLRLLNDTLSAGMALTEGFYGLYDLARRKLVAALKEQPSFRGVSEIDVFGKAHKLLNRALFAAFCEDHPSRLLPKGTLERLHQEAREKRVSGAYWSTFQRFFRELDRGSPPGSPHACNAFNGGLFASDPLLDGLRLPDGLFTEPIFYKAQGRESRAITGIFGFHAYDFAEELDVDSLGAIFEQSLKDLPHLEHALRGHGTTAVTRREAGGVYYTPPAITRFLVSRALAAVLDPIRDEVRRDIDGIKLKAKMKMGRRALTAEEVRDVRFHYAMLERLKSVSLIDPACGSGAFLVEALSQFHHEYERTNAALSQLAAGEPMFGLDRIILRQNLHGIDILPESVEIARLSIWLRTAILNEPLEKLDATIVSADSLRGGDGGAYDMVVSNPPWGAELSGWSAEEVRERFPSSGEERDTYALFMIRGYELLKPGGVLAYIVPNSWLTVDGYASLREWFLDHFEILELVNVWKIFRDVNHDACMVVARRRAAPSPARGNGKVAASVPIECLTRGTNEQTKAQQLAEERWHQRFEAQPLQWKNEIGCRYETMYDPATAATLDRIASQSDRLDDLCNVTVGIQVYHRRKVPESVIRNREFHSNRKNGRDWYPYVDGNEVQRYFQVPSDSAYLLYSDRLCDKRELQHYALPRILAQQIFWHRLSACLVEPEEPVLYLNTLFSVTARDEDVDLGYILAVLNSRLMSAAYERWTNRLFGDKFPKVSKLDLARLPIPRAGTKADKAKREELARLGRALNAEWPRLKSTVLAFSDVVSATDGSGKLGKTLTRFWDLTREDVIAELARVHRRSAPAAVEPFVKAWKAAVRRVNETWSRIGDLEGEVDALMCELTGLDPQSCERIVSRVPEITLDQVLLPR